MRRPRHRRRGAALQALDLLFELLIAVLQFLHLAGEIADRFLKAAEAGHDIARGILCARGLRPRQTCERECKRGRGAADRLKHCQWFPLPYHSASCVQIVTVARSRQPRDAALQPSHDPEKWKPVFRGIMRKKHVYSAG